MARSTRLLPAHHVASHGQRGMKIRGLWYDGPVLNDYRHWPSTRGGRHNGQVDDPPRPTRRPHRVLPGPEDAPLAPAAVDRAATRGRGARVQRRPGTRPAGRGPAGRAATPLGRRAAAAVAGLDRGAYPGRGVADPHGKTERTAHTARPRTRERDLGYTATWAAPGPPPRTRGTRRLAPGLGGFLPTTPAYAGNARRRR